MEFDYQVTVEASPELVWATLLDVEAWPTWTSSMTWLRPVEDGPLAVGSEVHIKQPGSRPLSWTITKLEAGRSFSWATSSGVHMAADHEIEPVPGGTRVTLRLTQTGVLSKMVGVIGGSAIRRAVRTEGDGLKEHCEAIARG
jgi:uncharacterized protein YndB with AHSA1/START domain